MHSFVIATTQSSGSLSKSTATINIGKLQVKALFDSGSTESFIHPNLVKEAGLTVRPASGAVSMASTALSANVTGTCTTNLEYQTRYTPTFIFQSFQGSALTSYWAWISSYSTRESPFSMEAANPRYLSVASVPSIWIQLSLLLI